METQWQVREANTQHVVFDEKALRLRELHLKRRVFTRLMRNILICACARRIRDAICARESAYLKRVSFLCLKQEMALQKHLRQLKRNKEKTLLRKALFALQRS